MGGGNMAFRDLREFITLPEQRGELIRIKAPVNPEMEITESTDRVSKGPVERNKALLFESVTGSAMPVLINAFGSARRMAWALGVEDLDELNHKLAAMLDLRLPQGLRATLDRAGWGWPPSRRCWSMNTRSSRRKTFRGSTWRSLT